MSITSIELLPLGTCAANRNSYQQESSYLLKIFSKSGENQILFDAGSIRCLDQQWLNPNKLSMIFISHGHRDHISYLGKIIQMLISNHRSNPLIFYTASENIKKIEHIITKSNHISLPDWIKWKNIDRERLILKDDEKDSPKFQEDWQNEYKIDIYSTYAIHGANCIVYRIKIHSKNSSNLDSLRLDLTYSPDTMYNSVHLQDFAENSQYWLLDTTFGDRDIDLFRKRFENNFLKFIIPNHSSPKYSAQMCSKANVKTYIVGHYFWKRFAKTFNEVEPKIKNAIVPYFSGKIIVSKDLEPIIL